MKQTLKTLLLISVRSEAKQQNEIVYKQKNHTHNYTRNKIDMNKTNMEVKTKKNTKTRTCCKQLFNQESHTSQTNTHARKVLPNPAVLRQPEIPTKSVLVSRFFTTFQTKS